MRNLVPIFWITSCCPVLIPAVVHLWVRTGCNLYVFAWAVLSTWNVFSTTIFPTWQNFICSSKLPPGSSQPLLGKKSLSQHLQYLAAPHLSCLLILALGLTSSYQPVRYLNLSILDVKTSSHYLHIHASPSLSSIQPRRSVCLKYLLHEWVKP